MSKLSKAFGQWIGKGVKKHRKNRRGWKGNYGHRGHGLFSSIRNPYNY